MQCAEGLNFCAFKFLAAMYLPEIALVMTQVRILKNVQNCLSTFGLDETLSILNCLLTSRSGLTLRSRTEKEGSCGIVCGKIFFLLTLPS